jgi:hypothetical protein
MGWLVWVQKKIFAVEVPLFSFCFEGCLLFYMVFLALFECVLWCASTYFVVHICMVCGAHWLC